MLSRCSFLTVAVFTTFLFTQCNKEDLNKVYNANFYTTKSNGKMTLYLNDVNKGELAYFATPPVCGQYYSDGVHPISFQLNSGDYKVTGKDDQGNVISYGTLHVSGNKIGVSGGMGGLRAGTVGDCLAVGLSE